MASTPAPSVTVHLSDADAATTLADDVRRGLSATPKRIPPRWLYDPRGSALFEEITELPEYYLTRAERQILVAYAPEIAARCGAATLVELGSGTSDKTVALLDALRDAGTLRRFVAFDVAEPTLRNAVAALSEAYPTVEVSGVVADFGRHLDRIPDAEGRLVAFLGSTIGNLTAEERARFLGDLAGRLRPGEGLLLGVDLVKDPARLLAAYDDADGVTAAFEKNVLAVVNTALQADFDLDGFDYVARWDSVAELIWMGLRSRRDQTVAVADLPLTVRLADGEEIMTETSAKFRSEGISSELEAAGFVSMGWWTDPSGDFALVLAQRAETAPGPVPPIRRALPTTASTPAPPGPPRPDMEGYRAVRAATEALAAPLSPEDQTVQTMPDVSPTKWHRAHVTWFFEQFVLMAHQRGYRPVDDRYLYLWNSYYEGAGPRHPRRERGLLSRPGVGEVTAYRDTVDEAMENMLGNPLPDAVLSLIELGLHHEQQHQELLLMDIKHVLGTNPLRPAYRLTRPPAGRDPGPLGWVAYDSGLRDVGTTPGTGFAFDNESPRHLEWVARFQLADRLVTAGEWLEFMADGGYQRPELWLSDGWAAVAGAHQQAPLYWEPQGADWVAYTLYGPGLVDPALPVVHVSYYEADAHARWRDARLPTEAEWEVAAAAETGPVAPAVALHPEAAHPGSGTVRQLYGAAWQWTVSGYLAYPGFRPAAGAVGEYNGKFMVGQHVLRGSAAITPPGHARVTYRNFFPPGARWPMTGVRLARDAG
jgi:dimethylhistidine N-methyltransferase